jgi:multiple sugar transport system permease protein
MNRASRRELFAGLAFLGPSLVGFVLFVLWPVALSLVLAVSNYDLRLHNMFKPASLHFVGLAHFQRLLTHPDFWRYLGNTLFLMLGIPFAIVGSLGLAVLLNRDLGRPRRPAWSPLVAGLGLLVAVLVLAVVGGGRSATVLLIGGVLGLVLLGGGMGGSTFYRALFYLPHFTAGVAVYILWKKLYNPNFGPLNLLLARFGIEGPAWLTDYHWAKPAIMVMGLWMAVGSNNMLLYLASLQQVPAELHEAAALDGAGAWQRFWHVTWPQLAPVTFYIFVISVISGLQGGFEMARAMTSGGPAGATTTLSYYLYTEGFDTGRMGFAAAVAWAILLLVGAMTALNWRLGGHHVEE